MALVGTFFFLVGAYLRESLCPQASENGQWSLLGAAVASSIGVSRQEKHTLR